MGIVGVSGFSGRGGLTSYPHQLLRTLTRLFEPGSLLSSPALTGFDLRYLPLLQSVDTLHDLDEA